MWNVHFYIQTTASAFDWYYIFSINKILCVLLINLYEQEILEKSGLNLISEQISFAKMKMSNSIKHNTWCSHALFTLASGMTWCVGPDLASSLTPVLFILICWNLARCPFELWSFLEAHLSLQNTPKWRPIKVWAWVLHQMFKGANCVFAFNWTWLGVSVWQWHYD